MFVTLHDPLGTEQQKHASKLFNLVKSSLKLNPTITLYQFNYICGTVSEIHCFQLFGSGLIRVKNFCEAFQTDGPKQNNCDAECVMCVAVSGCTLVAAGVGCFYP